MKQTLFISDLHLDVSRRDMVTKFIEFLQGPARQARALYILGDLFEVWIGDDGQREFATPIFQALHALRESGVATFFMHGNRDFLIGKRFAKVTGCELLADPSPIDLYGTPTLLTHGDLLCVDDQNYQRFRRRTRNPCYQFIYLHTPLRFRQWFAGQLRARSQRANREKPREIMDVNADEVKRWFERYDVTTIIHGHTHRPTIETLAINGKTVKRIVLCDWHERGNVLVCDESGQRLEYF